MLRTCTHNESEQKLCMLNKISTGLHVTCYLKHAECLACNNEHVNLWNVTCGMYNGLNMLLVICCM